MQSQQEAQAAARSRFIEESLIGEVGSMSSRECGAVSLLPCSYTGGRWHPDGEALIWGVGLAAFGGFRLRFFRHASALAPRRRASIPAAPTWYGLGT